MWSYPKPCAPLSKWPARLRIILTPMLVLACWQALAVSGKVSNYLLPSPATVFNTFITMSASGELLRHGTASLRRVFEGFALSCISGLVVACLTHRFTMWEELLAAPLALLRMIPPLAMTPLLILWLGIGDATKLTIIILASFFPIFLNTRDGLRRVDMQQRELARSLQLSGTRYFAFMVFPAAVPSIITGVRLAFGYSWRALIGAELIAASSGLGYMIINAQEMQQTDVVVVGILIIGALGWILDGCFYRITTRTLERRFPEVKN